MKRLWAISLAALALALSACMSTPAIKNTPVAPGASLSTSAALGGPITLTVIPSLPAEIVPLDASVLWSLDGTNAGVNWGYGKAGPITRAFDTRRLADGQHKIRAIYSVLDKTQNKWVVLGQNEYTFRTLNGATAARILPRFSELYLAPGESIDLGQRVIAANGAVTINKSIAFASSNTSVATVTTAGVVTKKAAGVATITASLPDLATVSILVADKATTFAHFTRDAKIITTVEPGRSVFVRSLFASAEVPAETLKARGINTRELGFMNNLTWSGRPDTAETLEVFKRESDARLDRYIGGSKAAGLLVIATGDDAIRTPREVEWTFTKPITGKASVQNAMAKLATYDNVLGVALVDEGLGWSDTTRAKIGFADWASFRAAIKELYKPSGVRNWWPRAAPQSPERLDEWCIADPVIDLYATDTITTTPGTLDLAGRTAWQVAEPSAVQYERTRTVYRGRPVIGIASVVGGYQDNWQQTLSPEAAYASIMVQAIKGCVGVRVYQEGWAVNDAVWPGVKRACELLEANTSKLLQPHMHAPHFGPGVYTTARRGAQGTIVIAHNATEATAVSVIDFSPYSGIANDIKTVTLAAHETRVWEW